MEDGKKTETVEDALRHRVAMESLVAGISSRFVYLQPEQAQDEFQRALAAVGSFAGVERVWLVVISGDEKTFSCRHEWRAPGVEEGQSRFQHVPLESIARVLEALRRNQPFISAEPAPPEAGGVDGPVTPPPARSRLIVPMHQGGRLFGMLGLDSVHQNRNWSDEDCRLIQVVADILAGALLRVESDRALRASEDRFRNLVENSSDMVWELDGEGRFTYASPQFKTSLGYEVSELLGSPVPRVLASTETELFKAQFSALTLDGRPIRGVEFRSRHKNGREVITEVSAVPVRSVDGRITGCRGVCRDISERKAAEARLAESEAQLRHSQKMEAVGRLAGGVAHDFNNLLTAISGYCGILRSSFAEGDPRLADLREVEGAAERAASLTRQLLAFSRRQVLEPKPVVLNVVIESMEKMLRRLIGEDIHLETALAPGLSAALADVGQLEQVIMNLAVNARDAMPKGGRLLIETKDVYLDEAAVQRHERLEPGAYVLLAVTDSGHGMEKEVLAHLFEPFFTTKAQGVGTGLGLSTVYGIVMQSKGHIYAYSEPGLGSTFKVYLPAAPSAAPAAALREEASFEACGGETVLLVEDEEPLRRMISMVLRANGYRVVEAHNGEEALAVSKDPSADFQVVVSDVIMPKMGGGELMKRIAADGRKVPVVLMSGYTDEAVHRNLGIDPGVFFIQKPMAMSSLIEKIRQALAASAPA